LPNVIAKFRCHVTIIGVITPNVKASWRLGCDDGYLSAGVPPMSFDLLIRHNRQQIVFEKDEPILLARDAFRRTQSFAF
jgi:hypothetical protein